MASGVTARKSRRGGDLWRAAKIVRVVHFASLATLVTVAAGCPARHIGVVLTPSGIDYLTSACAPETTEVCQTSNRPGPDFAGARRLEARLLVVTPNDGQVRDDSQCMSIAPCLDPPPHNSCLADALNQGLDGAIPYGLGFDGLRNPEEAQLLLAIYQTGDNPSADAPCREDNLLACAGLAQPLGGGNFDVSCASCQGGPSTPKGRDNTPCPAPGGCFLMACRELLRKNGNQ